MTDGGHTPQVAIDEREDFAGVGEARVELEGRQVGAEAIITATINGLKAEAMVKVISKREPPIEPREKKERGGLFRDVKFDASAEPRQPVYRGAQLPARALRFQHLCP